MSIERIELTPLALRFRDPYVTGRGKLDRRLLLVVQIHTGDGHVGLGETGPLMLRGGPGIDELKSCIEERYVPALLGAEVGPRDPSTLVERLRKIADVPQALAGIDLALWDLAGKIAGEPVWRLLGGAERPSVECNATLTSGSPHDVAVQARSWAADGFTAFKLKVGTSDDLGQVAAVREELGGHPRIRVDANACWSTAEAVDTLANLVELDVELCEQPVATVEAMVEVRRSSAIPLVADESVVSVANAQQAIDAAACDGVTVKLVKVGGISAAREIVAAAPTYLSSALDGPLGIAAALHASALLPSEGFAAGLAQGLATGRLFADSYAAYGSIDAAPQMSPPDGPGLGVEIDLAALDALRL